ncbi:PASTA domain-containing protein [Bifidobacterium sp. ESL0764]|uniref:zinc-ribbon domain-containing protein n=1 Tax=Bifidobacterium sp. ESL0764 TaxID=2983228 RepID=UPI0023F9095A|nr:PASTA domain-containing protein [Bifidobacterium sp. ESL0764]WEV65783.1 PASTA domain-containing protein [Bifidobacterium sp. ESL0764]
MRFCTNCGNKLDDNAQFCTACGTAQPATHGTTGNGSNGTAVNTTSGNYANKISQPAADNTMPSIPLPGNANASAPTNDRNASMPADNRQTTQRPAPAMATTPAPAQPTQPSAQPAQPAQPTQQTQPASGFADPGTATAVRKHTKKTLIIAIAAIVVVALVATIVGFGTYKAQMWGGKTVPSPAELGVVKSKKTHEFTAADVEKSLHKRGFKTVKEKTFSAKPKGSFLKYRGIDAHKRYSTSSQPITILASGGPGVPKGTSGQPVQNVTNNLGSMGVPVHYYKVITDTSKTKEGTVLTTYPSDGQAVTDAKTGINVGVATSGDGVDYSVVGQNKDQAKQQYAGKGFNVTLVPRFSSKKMIGKIVDSQPKPGSATNGGDLFLFYGIDASGMDDAVRFGPGSINDDVANAFYAPVGGTYCTKAGSCINLDQTVTLENPGDGGTPLLNTSVSSSELPGKYGTALNFCMHGGDPGCASRSTGDPSKQADLFYKNKGAFELMDQSIDQITCGTGSIARWDPMGICVNGQSTGPDYGSLDSPMSGASYEMKLHYVFFPVGSDVKGVVDSGYFDKAYVAKAKKQKPVDTSRPFFIRRDKSLYKTTKVNVPNLKTTNPFVPDKPGKMVPTKPAPSDETAYYLVDETQPDWSSLPEFTISKGGNKADPKPNAKNATPDQITKDVVNGDLSLIAGKYCNNANECLQLDKDGNLTGMKNYHDTKIHLAGAKEAWGEDSRQNWSNSPYLTFNGPDSDYKCPAGTGMQLCYDSGASEAEIQKPVYVIYVFKNADTSFWYTKDDPSPSPGFDHGDGPATAAKTDRPYLDFIGYHMNSAPADDAVYHLQE